MIGQTAPVIDMRAHPREPLGRHAADANTQIGSLQKRNDIFLSPTA
jgi:hypothetical protein